MFLFLLHRYAQAMEEQAVIVWLKTFELQDYSSLFTKAGLFHVSQCKGLDDKDLFNLGITMVGHRKRILAHLPDDVYEVPPPPQCINTDSSDTSEPPMLPPKTVVVSIPKQDPFSKPKPVPAPRNIKRQPNVKDEKDKKLDAERPIPRPRPSLNSSSRSGSSESGIPTHSPVPQSAIPTSNISNPLSALRIIDGTATNWINADTVFKESTSQSQFNVKNEKDSVPTDWENEEEDVYEPIWMGHNKPQINSKTPDFNNAFNSEVPFSPFRVSTASGKDNKIDSANFISPSNNTEFAQSNNFSLPPPAFPPPPLPDTSNRDDIKEFDPFKPDSPDIQRFPPVPPRPNYPDESDLPPFPQSSDKTSTPQKTSRPRSFSSPKSPLPHKHIPFMDDSFDLAKNVYSPNTHPSLKNVPSFVEADPFKNKDPFNDFNDECKNFNEGIEVAQGEGLTYVTEEPEEPEENIYMNEEEYKNSTSLDKSFDPFGLKSSASFSRRQNEEEKKTLSLEHVPPPMCHPEEDSFYEVAQPGFGGESSFWRLTLTN